VHPPCSCTNILSICNFSLHHKRYSFVLVQDVSWSVGRHPASHNMCLQLTWACNCAKLFSICNSGLHRKTNITRILLLLVQTSLNVCYVCCWYIVLVCFRDAVCICHHPKDDYPQQATDYYPFNICCIESLQCISCVIKFNSKRKLSYYVYKTLHFF